MANSPNTTSKSKKSNRKTGLSKNPNSESAYPFPVAAKQYHPGRPPDFHNEGYAVHVNGQCLEPVIFHDELISVEPILPAPGELACFFFKGKETASVKLNSKPIYGFPVSPKSEVVPLIEAMQFNPTRNYSIWGDQVLAIHRVRWVMHDGEWQSVNKLLQKFDWKAKLPSFIPIPREMVIVPEIDPRPLSNSKAGVPK